MYETYTIRVYQKVPSKKTALLFIEYQNCDKENYSKKLALFSLCCLKKATSACLITKEWFSQRKHLPSIVSILFTLLKSTS